MRNSVYSDAEILGFVREMEAGLPADEICRAAGVSLRTLYRWRRKFGGLKPFAVQALRRLEQENHRLRAEAVKQHSQHDSAGTASGRLPCEAAIRSDFGSGGLQCGTSRPPTVMGRFASLRSR